MAEKKKYNSILISGRKDETLTYSKYVKDEESGESVKESLDKKVNVTDELTTQQIKDGAITNEKMAADSVGNTNLQDGSVSNEKLEDGSITNEKLAENSITKDKLQDKTIGVEKLDNELRQTIAAATGLPENLVETIQNVDDTLRDHQSQLDDKQSQIDDKQQQITANDEDISLLQTRSTQMEETIKDIATTGGASQATAVTYNNEKSGLTAINAQAAIDETNTKLSEISSEHPHISGKYVDYSIYKKRNGYINNSGDFVESPNFTSTEWIELEKGDRFIFNMLVKENTKLCINIEGTITYINKNVDFIAYNSCKILISYPINSVPKLLIYREYSSKLDFSVGINDVDVAQCNLYSGYVNNDNNQITYQYASFYLSNKEIKEKVVVKSKSAGVVSIKAFKDDTYLRDLNVGDYAYEGEIIYVTSSEIDSSVIVHLANDSAVIEDLKNTTEDLVLRDWGVKDGYIDKSSKKLIENKNFSTIFINGVKGDRFTITNENSADNVYIQFLGGNMETINVTSKDDFILPINVRLSFTFPKKNEGISCIYRKQWVDNSKKYSDVTSVKFEDLTSGHVNSSTHEVFRGVTSGFIVSKFTAIKDGFISSTNITSIDIFNDDVWNRTIKDFEYIRKGEDIYVTTSKNNIDNFDVRFIEYGNVENENIRSYFPKPLRNDRLRSLLPNFTEHLEKLDKDVVIVFTGSSLTQGNIYVSPRKDASYRPPLMHSNDMISLFWDEVSMGFNQKYRLYDSGYFSENGNWQTIKSKDIWDDAAKHGWTRVTEDENASISFEVPVKAWQFNFIYRTDTDGATCKVKIEEGNGMMEVFNGTEWVEANEFVFSMLETSANSTKGNTVYQKRLKMRCRNHLSLDSTNKKKKITIQKISGKDFNYIGVEWSPSEFMVTVINSGRGGWAHLGTGSNNDILRVQDSDIWEYKPDLVMCHITAHNAGAIWNDTDPNYYVNWLKRVYFNEFNDLDVSLFKKSNSWKDCEVCFYVTGFGGHQDNGLFEPDDEHGLYTYYVSEAATNGDVSQEWVGKYVTRKQEMDIAPNYLSKNYGEKYAVIRCDIEYFKVGMRAYHNLWEATSPSKECGYTLSYDGIHANDNGAMLQAFMLSQIL